ncbi:MAG: succinate dehydrogenase, cytochrome b556 subunit [Methylobacteriaceae bacterium]|nr:succinate dehydrogenase, cytochrome b556 subunit [Methylobacteriaceae bacterium]
MAETDTAARRLEDRRPLSPHLDIYKMMFTMVMSGLHRITGIALYAGTLLLAWYFIAAATNRAAFDTVNWVYGSILGRIVLFGFTWSLFHHLMGGVRHAIWDAGYMFDPKGRELAAVGTLVGSVALTLIFWVLAYAVR